MASHVATQIVKLLISSGKEVSGSKILIMGATFKEDVKDNRNSKVADLIKELKDYNIEVDLYEPVLTIDELGHEFELDKEHFTWYLDKKNRYDGICYAVNHEVFQKYELKDLKEFCKRKSVFFDIKGDLFIHLTNHSFSIKVYNSRFTVL